MTALLLQGDARRIPLADQSVQCVITSPPYFGLRDYDEPGQIGLEPTPEDYVAALVGVFREVWRVLRDEGTAWLNLGDSYANDTKWGGGGGGPTSKNYTSGLGGCVGQKAKRTTGLKPKDLIGIPWRVAFALQDGGWYLRSEIIWAKPNPMPESVTDRPTKSHEQIFLLAKRERYYYDADAIREPHEMKPQRRPRGRPTDETPRPGQPKQAWPTAMRDEIGVDGHPLGRNKRSVWTVATAPFPGAHFATFPPALIKPCILAGCPVGGIVFDPFVGAGTTGVVATGLNRRFVGTDLSRKYLLMARRRIERPHAEVRRSPPGAPLPLFAETEATP